MKLQLVVAAILVVSAAAEPFESFSADPAEFGWVDGGRASPDTPLHFSVFVKQQHVDLLQQVLHEVADPDSPKFGQHLSNVEVHRLVEPSVESVTAVEAFLARAGVAPSDIRRSLNDDVLSATVSVAAAERLLGAEYHVFTHTASNITLVRTLQYELPEALQQHVDMVSPTVRFPHVFFGKRQGQTEERLRGSAGLGVTPTSLQQLFKTEGVTGRAPGNLQACTGFLSQFISPDDVQKFFKQFAPSESGKTFTVNGPNTPSQPGIEASLDVEYIMSVGSNVKTIFWSKAGEQPGNPANEPFLAWLEDVAALPDDKVPKVFSASYGDNEPGVEKTYAERVSTEFMKLGARGTSLMFSSGDGGVGGGQPTQCTTFIPTFPAGSPYVTAVGGSNADGSSAASLSSGGFSTYFTRPSWQDAAVSNYFAVAKDVPDKSRFSQTGAGIPDVAAPAEQFEIVYSGFTTSVAGTSCAAPSFTGVVSLVNDARLQAGKSSLGYLNLFIYKNGDLFQDITTGSNPGCGTLGFQAAPGWDPVTGFGLPDYTKWVKAALALP